MSEIALHLVSDASCDTALSVAEAVTLQFEGVQFQKNIWPLVRNKKQIDRSINK